MQAKVTVSVDTLPAIEPTTYRRDRFEVHGDGKLLMIYTINTDMFGIEEAFRRVRRRARRIEGATSLRYGMGTFTL